MIGSLRDRIELLTALRTEDDGGGASIAWLPGPEVWAEIAQLTAVRDVAGDRSRRLKRIAATIRHRSDISLGQQLRFANDNYEIVSIETDDGRARRLTLICEEAPL
ncbi:MAG: head-tail adaptor protein [Pseudomonadota bacterium]